jgi:hypothetical protein
MGGHHGVVADPGVVANVHQVVEFDARSNDTVTASGSINTSIRAKFALIMNNESACMVDFDLPLAVPEIPKPVTSQDDPGVNDAGLAEIDVRIEDDSRHQDRPGTDTAALPDVAVGKDAGPAFDDGVALHDRERADRRAVLNRGQGGHDGHGVHSWFDLGSSLERGEDLHERGARILHLDLGTVDVGGVRSDQNSSDRRRQDFGQAPLVFGEGDPSWLVPSSGHWPCDRLVGWAFQLAADQRRDLA